MSRREIGWAVKITALLVFFAMAFMGTSKYVSILGFMGIIIFSMYCVNTSLSRSSARAAEGAKLRKRALDDLHRIAEIMGCDE